MPHNLPPLRRLEAEQMIKDLWKKETFDPTDIVNKLADVIIGTPDIINECTRHLRAWNDTDQKNPRYVPQGRTTSEEIVEVVLNAAAIYRGETSEENQQLPPTQSDTEIIISLNNTATFLRSIAGGRTNRQLSESHASRLAQLAEVLSRRFNVRNRTANVNDT